MKNNIFLILYLVCSIFITGCDSEGDEINNSYLKVSASSFYPEMNLPDLYRVEYNGQDINSNGIFNRNGEEGKLQVFSKDTKELLLDTVITIKESKNIQLIKLPGKKMEIYNADDYISFSAVLALFDGFQMKVKGQQIVEGTNYMQKKDVTGDIEFYKEGVNIPVYKIENSTIRANDNFIFLQSSESEFLALSDDSQEEVNPSTEEHTKTRFFYTPIGNLNVDAIELEFICFDQSVSTIEVVGSIILEKGKLSSYFELDNAKYREVVNESSVFAYSIYTYDTVSKTRGTLIEDAMNGNNMFYLDTQPEEVYKTKYKFITYQITDGIGNPPKFVMGTEW